MTQSLFPSTCCVSSHRLRSARIRSRQSDFLSENHRRQSACSGLLEDCGQAARVVRSARPDVFGAPHCDARAGRPGHLLNRPDGVCHARPGGPSATCQPSESRLPTAPIWLRSLPFLCRYRVFKSLTSWCLRRRVLLAWFGEIRRDFSRASLVSHRIEKDPEASALYPHNGLRWLSQSPAEGILGQAPSSRSLRPLHRSQALRLLPEEL